MMKTHIFTRLYTRLYRMPKLVARQCPDRALRRGSAVLLLPLFFLTSGAMAHAEIVHRWSFNQAAGAAPAGTEIPDLVGGGTAYIRGTGATFNGNSVTLPGTTTGNQTGTSISAYVDLPNGIISSCTDLTIEIWATPVGSKNWQRLFDFGRSVQAGDGSGEPGEWTGASAPGVTASSDGLMLALQKAGNLNQQRLEATLDAVATQLDTALATALAEQHHYVITYKSGDGVYSTGGRITLYRDGVSAGFMDVAYALSDIEDVNNWLGRSQFSADSNSNITYNELRIHNNAFTPAEVASDYQTGPEMGLIYRWSFNDAAASVVNGRVFYDSISNAPAKVMGVGATLDGNAITLPGTTTGNQTTANVSAYVDLPNKIISTQDNLTIETWATPISSKTWQRMFDFGNGNVGDGLGATGEWTGTAATAPGAVLADDEFALTLNVGDSVNAQRMYGRLNYQQAGGYNLYSDSALATTLGQRYHFVMTFEKGVGAYPTTGGRQSWYRNGVLAGSTDLPYLLSSINDVNNWLGRSQFSGDPLANVSFDEFRIYSFALSPADIISSRDAGPNAVGTIPRPTTAPDAVSMHAGQKALITVLANDTGFFYAHTVAIATPATAGTTSITPEGRIIYQNTNPAVAGDSFTYTVNGPGGTSIAAQVTITFSGSLRIPNPQLAMPATAPPTFIQVTDALGGIAFTQPICIASIPGNTKRLFVGERLAKVQLIPDITAAAPTKRLFLDLQQVVAGRTPGETIEGGGNQEHGLLGLAFHPQYASNGYFYVAYTVRISGGSYYQRLSRFQVSAGDPTVANPASELILLQQLDRGSNHDGGDIHFGPDGYLYYGAGDEEAQRDIRQNSQKINLNFFSGIFRIDVDKKPGNREPNPHAAIPTDGGIARFSVPADNPFIHTSLGGTWDGKINGVTLPSLTAVRTEFWAYGLRHPWRFSFDSLTGDLWAGDVGQDTYEEIDLIQKGGNYGWVYREGFHDTNFTNPVPPTKPAGFTSIDPVYEYKHAATGGTDPQFIGSSVVGGIVYRGSRFPAFYGNYIFCDSVSGHIWQRNPTTGVVTRLTGVPGVYGGLVSMGVDPSNQDILFADYLNGRILRLGTGTASTSFPNTLTATRLFADLADLSPNPGLIPYEVNLPFWSDHAIKRRWFSIPQASGSIIWSRDGKWTFPTGSLWVKHFDLELTPGNPATKRRIETRVIVKTDANAYGVSYRWNDAQTEATLVPDEGVEFDLSITEGGVPHTQRWSIPSRSSCLTCHTPQAGDVLSFSTRQLNRSATPNGFTGNQLSLLYSNGFFANNPGSPNLLPRHLLPDETAFPVEARVRSYLAVNCSYCHQTEGTVAGANWDGRPQLTLAQTGLINGVATNNGGNTENRYIVPGDLAHSIALSRISASNGFSRMPPLATNTLDQTNIALLQEWIGGLQVRQTYAQWRLARFNSSNSPDGDPAADPDGDGATNNSEFISGTDPRDGKSFLTTQLSVNSTSVTLGFIGPINCSAVVEVSTDLVNWTPWDIPGNNGVPLSGTPTTFTGPNTGAKQFYRVKIEEN